MRVGVMFASRDGEKEKNGKKKGRMRKEIS